MTVPSSAGPPVVTPLTPDLFRPAFPLLRDALPELSLPDWLRFARRAAAPGRRADGVLAARWPGRPFPCGLSCWRITRGVGPGRHLTAEHVVAMDILDPVRILDAMIAELERLAVRHGCAALESVVRAGADTLPDRLLAGGHAPAASVFQKLVRGTANA